jgi:hypothetical protein
MIGQYDYFSHTFSSYSRAKSKSIQLAAQNMGFDLGFW